MKLKNHKNKTIADTPLLEYLSNFWTPNSEYAQFKRDVQKKPLSPSYIDMNHEDVRRHVELYPGFEGITVGSRIGFPLLYKKFLENVQIKPKN